MRHLVVSAALVAALSLAATGAASAQTTFQASVSATNPKLAPCQNGAVFCGSATIAGHGVATWSWSLNSLTSTTDPNCDNYTGAVTFMLGDGSTLVLNEGGSVCGPGNSLVAQLNAPAVGNPAYASGNWTVASATGQFDGLAAATGTDVLHAAGAQTSGTYSGMDRG
jgi:hypothetical protein